MTPGKFRRASYRSALSKKLNGLSVPEDSRTVIRYDGQMQELGAHITVEHFVPASDLLPAATEEKTASSSTSAPSGKSNKK